MKPVLLDTGCIVSLLDRSQRFHEQCVEVIDTLQAPFITCEAVITEACYLLRKIDGAVQAILENIAEKNFRIARSLSERAQNVAKLLKKYTDIPMALADACLVDLANEFHTGQILTIDSDFHIYRWGKNKPFEFLLEIDSPD